MLISDITMVIKYVIKALNLHKKRWNSYLNMNQFLMRLIPISFHY